MEWASPHNETVSNVLFVYGTLKRGYTNYERYLSHAIQHKKAEFLGGAVTQEKFPLVVRPSHFLPATCGPVLMDKSGIGNRVTGEVYRIDNDTLAAMDILEGVRSGHYYKKEVIVKRDSIADDFRCTAYFFPASEELLSLPLLGAYDNAQHAKYRPTPAVNAEIVELCQGVHRHRLSTPQPCPMSVLPIRLLPGDDIVRSLCAFAEERQLDAAIVVTCVGSTGRTTLRPAGVPHGKVFDGKFEIVSMTGTLSKTGHHLHMSISDPDCNLRGGHMLEGCIVRTTAEITLGVISGIEFTCPTDPRTGYDELSIVETSASKRQRVGGEGHMVKE